MKKKVYLGLALLLILGLAMTCRSNKGVNTSHSRAVLPYEATDFSYLLGMEGFSDLALKTHFNLYEGYVKNTNLLLDQIKEYAKSGRSDTPEYAELKRRLGFEFNGMRLHEYYFGNLGGNGKLKKDNDLYKAIELNFGSFEKWKEDFEATGAMRGIGWVVLYEDMYTGRLINMWINDHETNHLAGCNPLLVLDVFEHAYIVDYGLDRAKYMQAFFANLDWGAVAERFGVDAAEVIEPVQQKTEEKTKAEKATAKETHMEAPAKTHKAKEEHEKKSVHKVTEEHEGGSHAKPSEHGHG